MDRTKSNCDNEQKGIGDEEKDRESKHANFGYATKRNFLVFVGSGQSKMCVDENDSFWRNSKKGKTYSK